MTAPVFVDSKVFLYAMDEADPKKQQAARSERKVPTLADEDR